MSVLHRPACGKSSPSSRPICPGRRPEYPQAVHTVTHTVIRTHLPRFLSHTPCGARRPWLPAVPTRNYGACPQACPPAAHSYPAGVHRLSPARSTGGVYAPTPASVSFLPFSPPRNCHTPADHLPLGEAGGGGARCRAPLRDRPPP